MLVKRSLKRVVAYRGRRGKRKRRAKDENVEEMVRDGRTQKKKEGENYGGLLLCKHRSRSFHLAAICPPPQS